MGPVHKFTLFDALIEGSHYRNILCSLVEFQRGLEQTLDECCVVKPLSRQGRSTSYTRTSMVLTKAYYGLFLLSSLPLRPYDTTATA